MEDSATGGYSGLNLPFSPEAEQSVLGAVLLDSSCMDRVAEILPRPDYFYLSGNSLIYSVMLSMFTEGRPIDFVTVLEGLQKTGKFDEADGKTYLLQLAQMVPSISNVESYASIVRDKYDVRTLITTARDIIEEASSGEADAASLLDSAEQRIFDIRRGKNMQGLQRVNEIILQEFDRLDRLNSPDAEKYRGVPTGFHELDEAIAGLNRSDFILLGARPGMGKTSFALNIARHAAVKAGKRVAFFSLEMSKEQLVSRLLSTEAMVEGTKLRTGRLSEDEWVRLIEAGDILSKTELYFDDNPTITVPEIKAKLRRLDGVDLAVIDYLQLMTSSTRIDNRVQEISQITRSLKIMAKELDIPVLTLSQLARDSEKRTNHRPVLSDLRDSGSIEQDADVVLFLYRDDYYPDSAEPDEDADRNRSECIIAKNRHGETKTIPLHWQGEYMRFTAQEVIHNE
ncbi:MAG TPA: replicative DNA helicase [Ruminococcaceae bacterium]|nr:replicative DNA helicase [Oscillospiraceae bacterium]HBG54802.1 replicative DNA helicase [Oscillospiraceae bacterium]HBQ46777.1 replicative DNA helicase [Oscillospiraceae bacterium]HBT90451.1 replicative DNA helicase [Oscillospiraceae bacterium]HCB91411.1 replicative DNA helicase [Oscillospiraceae bacterium]